MKKVFIGIGIILLAAIALFVWRSKEVVAPAPAVVYEGAPTFTWNYRSFEKNDLPHSDISLVATYSNGMSKTKLIDTIEGGCNEYVSPDKDVYKDSTMIICYYAGFGQYYKVVERDGGYDVQRREFEEASPDYNPPKQEFKTIATF